MGNIEAGIKKLERRIKELGIDVRDVEGVLDRYEAGSYEYTQAKKRLGGLQRQLSEAQDELNELYTLDGEDW